ncbi:hypothetical protein A2U01_0092770, partial [Trifolium medium]|nr:hypothetical protein [Trifolium medium]
MNRRETPPSPPSKSGAELRRSHCRRNRTLLKPYRFDTKHHLTKASTAWNRKPDGAEGQTPLLAPPPMILH